MTEEHSREYPVIEFRNVSLVSDDRAALVGVSFKLYAGDMTIIIGASGAGKTVILHLAIGLLRPTEGEILIQGREIEKLDETELLDTRSRLMGLVFQEDTIFTGLTLYENTAYRLTERGWPDDETDRAVNEILTFVGLEKDVDKIPEEMSIGMRRRLELARALIGWPPIMLFDEPTSGLDPINARQVMDLVIRARDVHRMTSLYVTKEPHEISYLSSHRAVTNEDGTTRITLGWPEEWPPIKVMVTENGRVAFYGAAQEFRSSTHPAILSLTRPRPGSRVA